MAYSKDLRKKVVTEAAAGVSYDLIADKYGVSKVSISRWVNSGVGKKRRKRAEAPVAAAKRAAVPKLSRETLSIVLDLDIADAAKLAILRGLMR